MSISIFLEGTIGCKQRYSLSIYISSTLASCVRVAIHSTNPAVTKEQNFEVKHVSTEEITYLKDHGDPNAVSAKAGTESDQERHGINYAIFVLGKLAAPNAPNTLNANDLYPKFVYKKPEEALSDRKFVLGDDTE